MGYTRFYLSYLVCVKMYANPRPAVFLVSRQAPRLAKKNSTVTFGLFAVCVNLYVVPGTVLQSRSIPGIHVVRCTLGHRRYNYLLRCLLHTTLQVTDNSLQSPLVTELNFGDSNPGEKRYPFILNPAYWNLNNVLGVRTLGITPVVLDTWYLVVLNSNFL